MLLKPVGILLVSSFFVGMGYYGALKLQQRAKVLRLLEQFLEALGVCLSVRLEPPKDAIQKLLHQPAYDKLDFLQKCVAGCDKGLDFPTAWSSAFSQPVAGLLQEELDWLDSLGHILGQTALPMQTAVLEQVRVQLKAAAAAAEERYFSQGKVYKTVGLLSGALITVVLL